MPKVLWLLEHVRLRVDPLKDAAGSPFGKADRLYLYLHVQKLCVEWGSTNTAIPSCISIAYLLCLKRHIAKLPLRAGLIRAS